MLSLVSPLLVLLLGASEPAATCTDFPEDPVIVIPNPSTLVWACGTFVDPVEVVVTGAHAPAVPASPARELARVDRKAQLWLAALPSADDRKILGERRLGPGGDLCGRLRRPRLGHAGPRELRRRRPRVARQPARARRRRSPRPDQAPRRVAAELRSIHERVRGRGPL